MVTPTSPIPAWLAWGAVVLACSATLAWATSVSRIGSLEKQDTVIESAVKKESDQAEREREKVQALAVETGIIKTDVKYIREAIDRMERRERRSSIRSAGGRDE